MRYCMKTVAHLYTTGTVVWNGALTLSDCLKKEKSKKLCCSFFREGTILYTLRHAKCSSLNFFLTRQKWCLEFGQKNTINPMGYLKSLTLEIKNKSCKI